MTCRSYHVLPHSLAICFDLPVCYSTFTPNLPLLNPPRPVTSDDLERDHVLSQRIILFKWVKPSHLDLVELEGDEPAIAGFLDFAQQGDDVMAR